MKNFSRFFSLSRPFIIAEAGVNHGGNLKNAIKYVDIAKQAGADAIKFQTYKAELIASRNSKAYWDLKSEKTKNQFDLFKKYDSLNFKDYLKLKMICDNRLIKIYKISSSDITNIPLLEVIGRKNKPVILSTGASTVAEIKRALKTLNLPKNKVCIMHCVLNYPTIDKNANLAFIKKLEKKFPKILVGYSDHTKPDDFLSSLLFAHEMGAMIVEKHFTLTPNKKGNDHYHSMTGENLKNFFSILQKKNLLLGKGVKNLKVETKSRIHARRGIYAKKKIKKGEKLTKHNIIPLRPAINSIKVENWKKIIGRVSKKNYKQGDPI